MSHLNCHQKDEGSYLFVGGCWLIDGELQRSAERTLPLKEVMAEELVKEPGTSSIMRGSAWDESKVETFRIK
jgi:hypothetical protein